MEPEFNRDMADILNDIDNAEVITIIMPFLGQCLVYDYRTTAEDAPLIMVSPPLGSAERRLRQLNQKRPNLPRAKEMVAVPWPGSVDSLVRSEIWDRLVQRVAETGFKDAVTSCQDALDELKKWERRSLAAMIRGEGPFHTLWSRAGKS